MNPSAKKNNMESSTANIFLDLQSEALDRLTEAIVLFATQSDLFVFPHKPRFHTLGLIPFCVPAILEYGMYHSVL